MTKRFTVFLSSLLLSMGLTCSIGEVKADDRPNILWIIADDLSPELGCYDYKGVNTPSIDALAKQGARYTSAFSTAPVCSTSRSAFITGVYQTSTGTHHHRMATKQPLPVPMVPITKLLKDAGYFVCNSDSTMKKPGKSDYNFTADKKMYDAVDWTIGSDRGRKPDQPFFAQVQIKEPHRNFVTAKDPNRAAGVKIPAYYPEHPVIRADWANYLETIELLDRRVGNVLGRLEQEGLADNTLVFFFGDHGRPHYRDKQWLYDGGLRVPLLVRWPNKIAAGTVRKELVSLIDVSAATIAAAGLVVPEWMHGQDMLDAQFTGRSAVFAARDRAGSTLDRARCIRTPRYKYIRNFYPDRPYSQHSGYKVLQYPGLTAAQVLHNRGELSGPASVFWTSTRPPEELYDIVGDPEELSNLASTSEHSGTLLTLRTELDEWIVQTNDHGRIVDPNEEAESKSSRLWYVGRMKKRGFGPDFEPEQYLKWWEKNWGLTVQLDRLLPHSKAGLFSVIKYCQSCLMMQFIVAPFSLSLQLLAWCLLCGNSAFADAVTVKPNILFLLTDDQRADGYRAAGNDLLHTPNLDRIAARGTRFTNAFVTLAICSPSRAACLTGRYGSSNGVTSVGKERLNEGEPTFARALREAGYLTGVTGKWHLKTTPAEAGFDFASTCWSNGTWYGRQFTIEGEKKLMPGFVDDVTADESIRFMQQAQQQQKPFVLWMNTQVPHMDHDFTWPAEPQYLQQYNVDKMPLPETWNEDLSGKPEYLKTSRNRTRALEYGYDKPEAIRAHARDYYAGVQQMDAAVGRVLDQLDELGLSEQTWVIYMGDNGWMLGEHGMTSKVLPYEESMHVPMAIAPPKTSSTDSAAKVDDALVLNIDLTATIYELADIPAPKSLHGRSLLPLIDGKAVADWRNSFLYEAPTPQLGSKPLWAVRTTQWKYIESQVTADETFRELYNIKAEPIEVTNLADDPQHAEQVQRLAKELQQHRKRLLTKAGAAPEAKQAIPTAPPAPPRTDLHISGVYPHLTTYGVYSQNGAHYSSGHNECGIGAIVPWAGKLWMVNYAPHMPKGSEHKLFSVDPDLSQQMTVHPESVGGTPAGRMIHAESKQLLIAHHLIDSEGNVRTISPKQMPIRVTAIARHLKDPANMVYYIDMEGSIWEANVHTLEVERLFKKPVPGWHGKGGYTSQGRLVISNNGELHVGDYKNVLVGGAAKNEEERGVLAKFDGMKWKIVERRQFTEVTGPNGIAGGSDGNDPIWTMGWDRRSVRLKVLDNGSWHTYLLPKAAFCNDASHGWYTEWPRIREITNGRWMMDMHGMFFDFPKTFSAKNSAGIQPIGSHLRYVPDFCDWNGKLVLASDETSIQGNHLAGQPQSNLWFGSYEDLKNWGPASGYGGPWIEDKVKAGKPSDPFLIAGFDRRTLHLATGRNRTPIHNARRATDQQTITSMPEILAACAIVTVNRGNWHKAAPGYSFRVDSPVTVYLAVDKRGNPKLPNGWQPTELSLTWGKGFKDRIYSRDYAAGEITIPANPSEHTQGSFGMPHTAFVVLGDDSKTKVTALGNASVALPQALTKASTDATPVTFSIEVDRKGTGQWAPLDQVEVPANGYAAHSLPGDLDAAWLRIKTNRDCIATAVLHQTTSRFSDGKTSVNAELFDGLANASDENVHASVFYPAKRNRNLRVITANNQHLEFTKAGFEFEPSQHDAKLKKLLQTHPEFTVDGASVILKHRGRNLRFPKGSAAYNKPFASGWPRASREVQSERHLANIHGTFYEVPLVTNGAPPAWHQVRPVSSHNKQITDFCSWNGLLVLAGIRQDATNDGHIFSDSTNQTALWFGAIDDLWKLGKPIGQGGPWKNTTVKAGQPSDAYLMTGYDRKTLSVTADANTTITIEVDIDHQTGWHAFLTIELTAGQQLSYEFPAAFSAHWVRFRSSVDCTATAQLTYE